MASSPISHGFGKQSSRETQYQLEARIDRSFGAVDTFVHLSEYGEFTNSVRCLETSFLCHGVYPGDYPVAIDGQSSNRTVNTCRARRTSRECKSTSRGSVNERHVLANIRHVSATKREFKNQSVGSNLRHVNAKSRHVSAKITYRVSAKLRHVRKNFVTWLGKHYVTWKQSKSRECSTRHPIVQQLSKSDCCSRSRKPITGKRPLPTETTQKDT